MALFQQPATPVRVAFLAVTAIAAGVVGVSASLGDPDGGSPAAIPLGAPPHVIFGAVPVEHGQAITMGDLRLHNPSGADVEIVDVEVNRTDNLELVGVNAHYPVPQDYGGISSDVVFPPTGVESVPALGHVFEGVDVPPRVGGQGEVEVFLGIALTSGDLGGVNGVRITYRLGDAEHTASFTQAVLLPRAGTDAADRISADVDAALLDLGLLESSAAADSS